MKNKVKHILNKTLSTLSFCLLLFAIGLLSYVVFCKINGTTPQLFGYSFHFVVTDSMEPDIMVGDFVIGKKVSVKDLYEANKDKEEEDKDVILFVSPNPSDGGIIIVHKIREINEYENGYKIYTYGINNPEDDIFPTSDVIGKVVVVSGFFGKIFNPLGIIFLLLIFGTLIIFYFAIKAFIKNYREYKEDADNLSDNEEDTDNLNVIEKDEKIESPSIDREKDESE